MNKTREKNNTLIAEFMGLALVDCRIATEDGVITKGYMHPKCSVPMHPESLQYGCSWDWLMPVAESCFERLDVTDTSASEIQRQLSVCDKAGVYEAIVEFIKTYQKKPL